MVQWNRLTVRVSDEARRGFARACESEGVSLAALIEAAGRALDREPRRLSEDIAREARAIDIDRRSR